MHTIGLPPYKLQHEFPFIHFDSSYFLLTMYKQNSSVQFTSMQLIRHYGHVAYIYRRLKLTNSIPIVEM